MQFHEMGMTLRSNKCPWGPFAEPINMHRWPGYSSKAKLLQYLNQVQLDPLKDPLSEADQKNADKI